MMTRLHDGYSCSYPPLYVQSLNFKLRFSRFECRTIVSRRSSCFLGADSCCNRRGPFMIAILPHAPTCHVVVVSLLSILCRQTVQPSPIQVRSHFKLCIFSGVYESTYDDATPCRLQMQLPAEQSLNFKLEISEIDISIYRYIDISILEVQYH